MKKEKQKSGKKQIVLIVAGIVFGVLAVIYLAFAFYFHSHFLFHTKINGTDSSCATVSDVEDKERNRWLYTFHRGTGWKDRDDKRKRHIGHTAVRRQSGGMLKEAESVWMDRFFI